MTPPRLSVVVAVEQAAENLPAIVAALNPAAHADCEFIFCAADPGQLQALGQSKGNLRVLVGSAQARIPHLWRDAIVAARADIVALLSAHVVPEPGWLAAASKLEWADDLVGIGGWFSNDPKASASDWAVYLLRYAAFSRPRSAAAVDHVAADNALYRRSAVLECTDLLPGGFWEVEYHVRFLAAGRRLSLSPALQVVHSNLYAPASFAAQRREHGFTFGRDRARRLRGASLAIHVLALPVVPALLYAKVLARIRRHGLAGTAPLTAYAWLAYFVLHWAWGEARGVMAALLRRSP